MAKPSSSSFSLPAQRGGRGGGSKQTSPTGPFSTALHCWCLLHSFKNRRFKSQVELAHPESQRTRNQEERRKRSFLSLFPHPQWSWKTWSLISQLLVHSEKQMISPEMLEDKCGSSDQQVLRCCDISSSCAGLLSSSPTISNSSLPIQTT